MSKLLIFNFDGTSNEPEDAEQEFDNKGAVEDENITNILKFHLLCGGNLKDEAPKKNTKQISFYYNGVGTYGNFFQRLYNAGLSSEKFDVAKILRHALENFTKNYKDGDRVLVTGFSRGAALARRFASIINDKVKGKDIIEAVFDTVAAIGLPNMNPADRPKSEVVFENGHTLPSNVKQALHCLSIDDKRKAFQPTLMNKEDKITEVWFAGAHSDVGGGYYYDGLADLAFRFMLDWIEDLGRVDKNWNVNVISPVSVDYENLVKDGDGYSISQDDVSIDPNVFGKSHEQTRNALVAWATLTDRVVCVVQNDEFTNIQPVVHHSVAQRIAGDKNYMPQSLKKVAHKILYDDGSEVYFKGYVVHKENVLNRLNILDIGEQTTTVALSYLLYNRTGIFIEQGTEYDISVKKVGGKDQTWRDADVTCDANGWDRGDVTMGWKEIAIAGMEPFRRVPKADWFCLCGTIGDKDDNAFQIGKKKKVKAPASGELCLFANDLNRFYGNNFGKLAVTIKRVA